MIYTALTAFALAAAGAAGGLAFYRAGLRDGLKISRGAAPSALFGRGRDERGGTAGPSAGGIIGYDGRRRGAAENGGR